MQIKDSEARHKITKDLLKRVYKEFNEKSLAVTKDHLMSVGAGDEDHFQLLGSIKEEDANKEGLQEIISNHFFIKSSFQISLLIVMTHFILLEVQTDLR